MLPSWSGSTGARSTASTLRAWKSAPLRGHRQLPAGAGVLTVFGDNLDNNITVSRDAAGKILVNGGAVAVLGGTPPSPTRP